MFICLRRGVGIPDWPSYKIHRPCTCHRANFRFRHGLSCIPQCRNFPLEWYFGVSSDNLARLAVAVKSIFLQLQNYFLWYYHEKLCWGQYIAQVAHNNKICLEDVEQFIGNDYFHVSGSRDRQQQPRMEHLVHPFDNTFLFVFPSHR